ncbi:hypothetical protein STEG23_014098 [Scotinomys teguina]
MDRDTLDLMTMPVRLFPVLSSSVGTMLRDWDLGSWDGAIFNQGGSSLLISAFLETPYGYVQRTLHTDSEETKKTKRRKTGNHSSHLQGILSLARDSEAEVLV